MSTIAIDSYKSGGPVLEAFIMDREHNICAILGPQGGGKSVGCIMKILTEVMLMPACRDGVVRARWAAVRDTYGRLDQTTIPTWKQWLPPKGSDWTGGGGRQAHHRLNLKVVRGGREVPIELEMIFAAISDQSVEDFMRGFEVTGFWLNEMDRLPEEVLTYGWGRTGRFPRQADMPDGVQYRRAIIGDLNAPDIDSWFFNLFEEKKPVGYKLYRQPSGRSSGAENLMNLREGYYAEQVQINAHKPRWIKRFVDAEYGPSEDGQPVYPEYADERHLSAFPLSFEKNVPLRVGIDAGKRGPAAVFGQWMPGGQWRILGEVVPGRCGTKSFAAEIKRWITDHAPGAHIEGVYADPYGFTGADKTDGELAWAETLSQFLELPVLPAPSNEIKLRLDAVRDQLTYHDADGPGLMLSRGRTPMLRKGFASHYRFAIQRVGQTQMIAEKPEKNQYADPHDALQYMILGAVGKYAVVSGERGIKPGSRSRHRVTTVRNTTNVFGGE